MGDDTRVPVFTGAELALADTLILILKVMAMHGVIDPTAIDTVFSDLENRYRGQELNSAAAMAEYLRQHAVGEDQDLTLVRLRSLLDRSPEGSA
jgi:ribonuclease PH